MMLTYLVAPRGLDRRHSRRGVGVRGGGEAGQVLVDLVLAKVEGRRLCR